MKVRYTCPHCGSADVLKDAFAAWNEDTQRWELEDVYDDGFCRDCEETLKDLNEEPIE